MILVTNDDGVESAGIKGLAAALETLDSVYVVAPDRERSAIGMAIWLLRSSYLKAPNWLSLALIMVIIWDMIFISQEQ